MTPLLHPVPSATRFSVIKSGKNLGRKQRGVWGGRTTFFVGGGGGPPPPCHSLNSDGLPHFYAGDYAKKEDDDSTGTVHQEGRDQSCVTPCDPPPTTKDLSEPLILPDHNRRRGPRPLPAVRLSLKVRAASPYTAETLPMPAPQKDENEAEYG